jgi:Protein of unknown function (DUF4065)
VENSGAAHPVVPISFTFDSRKAAQAACRLLNQHQGNLTLGEVIKLLYFVDRESLIRTGRPVTGDRMISMEHGTMLSRSYALVEGRDPDPSATEVWCAYVGEPGDGHVVHSLRGDDLESYQALSDWELDLIDEIEARLGNEGFSGLREKGHRLPEYRDPGTKSLPIDPRTILVAEGWSDDEIAGVQEDAQTAFAMATILRNE